MDFVAKLTDYAELIAVHGLNIQKGQFVNIVSEACHRELAFLVGKRAYELGASYVSIDLSEPRLLPERAASCSEEQMAFVPQHIGSRYGEVLSTNGANLRIVGLEDPDLLEGMDPKKINASRMGVYKAIKTFYDEGIGRSKVHWCVAAAATPKWGQRLFPALSAEAAYEKLWCEIFAICRVGAGNHLAQWREHNATLHRRATRLTELGIKALRFVGPGTDLTVGLSTRAVFKGGGEIGPHGVEFEPNIPTEECFTTPDWRKTNGVVRATRPFLVNGKLIKGLIATFRDGNLVDFSAESGAETFKEYIDSDAGGRRLGEVALVGVDSPIFQSGVVFEEILFDENAACHIAVGSAYKFCLKDGPTLPQSELDQLGCNESSVHTDMMISSQEVDVVAELYSGKSLQLLKNGQWSEF